MILLLGGLFAFNTLIMTPKKNTLINSKNTVTQRLDAAKAATAKAMTNTTNFVEQTVKVMTILYLEERRRDQAKLFMALANQMDNQSWLVSLVHANNSLNLKGIAINPESASALYTRLINQPLLENVNLENLNGVPVNGRNFFSFDFKANTVFSEPQVTTEGLPSIELPTTDQIKTALNAISADLAKSLDNDKVRPKAL
jgi:Tfp pilus assembly protein PilN